MTEQPSAKTAGQRAVVALKGPRVRRIALWLTGLLLAFGALGYLAGPPALKWLLEKKLAEQLHRQVSIERIDINPYALSAKVAGFSVKAEGGREVVGFDELFVNLSGFSLFQFGVVVDEIRLQGPRVAVARVAEGKYDISDLLDEWLKPKEPSPTPRFSINNIEISGGKAVFDDQPTGRLHTVSDIKLGLPFISSLPYQAEIVVEPNFSAVFDGAPLVLKGRSKEIFEGDLESELNIDLDHLDLAGLQPYLPSSLPLRVSAGTLDSELRVVFKEVSEKVFSLTVVGSAHISGLAIGEANGSPLLAWKRLDVEIDSADLVNRRFAIKRVLLDGMESFVAVTRGGDLNWLRLADQLAGSAGGAASNDKAVPPAKAPEWSVEEIRVSNGRMHWQDESTLRPTVGDVLDINVAVGRIDGTLSKPIEISEAAYRVDLGERLRMGSIVAKGVSVDLPGHRIVMAEVGSRETRALIVRNKEGVIEWLSPPVLKTVRKAREQLADERPWLATVNKLKVDDVALRVEDRSTAPVAVLAIDGFSLMAENLTTEPGKKGTLALQSRVNQKGSLKVDGSVQLMPAMAALKVETQAIPLLPLQPYFTRFLNIALTRGQVSNRGELTAQLGKDGLNASYKGSLTLGDLLAVDKVNNADFLKWKSLYFGGIDFRLQPLAVNVGEVALSDFYSRLILSKEGRLNLQDIVRKGDADSAQAVAAGEPAKPAPAAAPEKAASAMPPLKIGKITLQGGKVYFSDFFVKPNYTVTVDKVGGRVSGLSSAADTVADLELRGSYAGTAPVQVVGKLNPLAAKSFLDIKADVSGVDLVPFSPYSGKYAGYNIEKGKLSLNVAYKLENNQLAAENRLFIDQLTFGDKVESPDATSLPVNLAISLLKNNRGEIDLNLPIAGSLDDPQFSVGGVIVQVIVNLFVKAVTSPFALLGSIFGGGEELSNVEFGPGRATFDEAATKRLEALAKALTERDSLKLEITGRADPEADKEGIKRVAMERAVKGEKLKDQIKKGREGGSLDALVVDPAEYPEYLKRAYKEAKFPKPRNLIGMLKELPVEEMEKLMLTNLPASDDNVRELALQRAENVQAWLVEQGKVLAARVFLLPPKVGAADKDKASRVDFSLR